MTNQNNTNNNMPKLNRLASLVGKMEKENAERKARQFGTRRNPEYTADEMITIQELVTCILFDKITRNALTKKLKEFKADGKSHAEYFVGINTDRTYSDVKGKIESEHKLAEKLKADGKQYPQIVAQPQDVIHVPPTEPVAEPVASQPETIEAETVADEPKTEQPANTGFSLEEYQEFLAFKKMQAQMKQA